MYGKFEYITELQYKVKGLERRVQAFESGEAYAKMRLEHQRQIAAYDRRIKGLKSELALAYKTNANMAKNWFEVFEDVEKEHAEELLLAEREIAELKAALGKAEQKAVDATAKNRELYAELYKAKAELENEQGKNLKLMVQLRRDHENSSIPSSQKPNHRKISNNREKTGKKPGGQPGHAGHKRKKLKPTKRVFIPGPSKYAESPDFKPTGKTITKQMVSISLAISVDEYSTPEYRNLLTGQRVHGEFPAGVVNDVNYDGSVKAFAFLLNNHCCVSMDKTCEFISWLSNYSLNISKGMVASLCKEFSKKTEEARRRAFAALVASPVMHADFTNARVNGKSAQVLVCASPDGNAMYFAKEHKGLEGIAGTPVELSNGTLIHDHDLTFYNFAKFHQECLEHILRYLKNSIENEPGLTWNKQMRALIREMIHYIKGLSPGDQADKTKAADFCERYHEILRIAKSEYEYEPPSNYYKDGFNLYVRMDKYSESHLLFLYDPAVPFNNNLSERLLRVFKRKLRQTMTFRSFEGLDYFCQCLSTISSLRLHGANLFNETTKIFGSCR